eukprot:2918748-Rhodomonas_salina.5
MVVGVWMRCQSSTGCVLQHVFAFTLQDAPQQWQKRTLFLDHSGRSLRFLGRNVFDFAANESEPVQRDRMIRSAILPAL